jgi:hypothetical protein
VFQLFVEGDDLGALNLLARRPRAFTDESERIGLLFASHAAVALVQAQKLNHLSTALVSRDVIGRAKGVLMERYKITADQAFACSQGRVWTPTADFMRSPITSRTPASWPPNVDAQGHRYVLGP